jgi:hypothetical protein
MDSEHDADHSPQSAKVTNPWSFTSIYALSFTAWFREAPFVFNNNGLTTLYYVIIINYSNTGNNNSATYGEIITDYGSYSGAGIAQ